MKRQLVLLMLMFMLGLQGSVAAMASPTEAHCHATAASRQAAAHRCCPDTGLRASCCPDTGVSAIGLALAASPLVWQGRPPQSTPRPKTLFASRAESPLIRPPIL